MSTVVQFAPGKSSISGYRFGQIELRIASERLWVNGKEAPLSPMAFRFLLGLCRASGALLTRAEAFDLLWPGGGNGSDEALAQVVAKVRQALGPDAAALVTLRSRGFRIDLPVEPMSFAYGDEITGPQPAPPPTLMSVPTPEQKAPAPAPVAEKRKAATHRRTIAIVALIAAAAIAALVAIYWREPQNAVLDGYAVSPQQFGPISAQGVRTLRDTLARDDEGDRPSAQRMLESLLESEPHSAAAPFFLFYLIGNDPQNEANARWRSAFDERLPTDAPPYIRLVSRWLTATGDPGVQLELLNAALKLEPSAWRLHLARAHVALRLSHFDQALADLRAVPLDRVPPRYALLVMSDRASLGDADAMQAELPALAKRSPLIADYVHARIEMARADWKAAQISFETTAQHAERDGLFGVLSYSWLLGAVAAGEQGNWKSMIQDAEHALRTGNEHASARRLFDGYSLLGYARYRQDGNAEHAVTAWDRANDEFRKSGNVSAAARLWLLRARIDPAWGAANSPPAAGTSAGVAGLDELLAARHVWLGCAAEDAKQALTAADTAGIDGGYFADEADLLRQDLGLPRRIAPAPPPIPYPMLERWISYWESAREAGIRACAQAR